MGFFKELWKEKISLLGLLVSVGLFVYSNYHPVSIPVSSQSILSSDALLSGVGSGSGVSTNPVVISLELVSIFLGVLALFIGGVRINRRRRK